MTNDANIDVIEINRGQSNVSLFFIISRKQH